MSLVKSAKYRHLGGNVAGGDPACLEYGVAMWLVEKYEVKTVLDVGCGEGQMVDFFKGFGCWAVGLEGLPRNAEAANFPTIVWDITDGPLRIDKIDLVWCVEVAEHIDEIFVDDFIETLANGALVCMTFSPPGQRGYHHVNCQPEEYWIEKMETAGYGYMDTETVEMRTHAHGFIAETGLLFGRKRC